MLPYSRNYPQSVVCRLPAVVSWIVGLPGSSGFSPADTASSFIAFILCTNAQPSLFPSNDPPLLASPRSSQFSNCLFRPGVVVPCFPFSSPYFFFCRSAFCAYHTIRPLFVVCWPVDISSSKEYESLRSSTRVQRMASVASLSSYLSSLVFFFLCFFFLLLFPHSGSHGPTEIART